MASENVFSDFGVWCLEMKKRKKLSKIDIRREQERRRIAQKRVYKDYGKMVGNLLIKLKKTLGLRRIRLINSLSSYHCNVRTYHGEIISWELRRKPINEGPSLILHVGLVVNKGIPNCFDVSTDLESKNLTKSPSRDDLIEVINSQKSHIMEAITRECLYN